MEKPPVYDVAVVGGGPAGVAAALSAAYSGARVLLTERASVLGGNVSQALVHTICGLYLPAACGDALAAHQGLPATIAAGLEAAGSAGAPVRAGKVWYLPIDPEGFARHARSLCERSVGLTCRMDCAMRDLRLAREASAPWELHLFGGPGESVVLSKLLIDASGDAAAAVAAGADFAEESGDTLQHPSYIFRLDEVETEDLTGFARLRVSHAVASAVRCGDLPAGCEALVLRPGIAPGQVFVTLNVPKPAGRSYDPLDDEFRLELEAGARLSAEAIAEYLRRTRAAFRQSQVGSWPQRIGIRETRRVLGRVLLDREDVLAGRSREDEVALSSWPIELWDDHRRARFEHVTAPSSVPLGALVSRSHDRLGMAGRCASATHDALGALRVVGTAMATGEAIGVAAAIAANEGVGLDRVAPDEVRRRIIARAGAKG